MSGAHKGSGHGHDADRAPGEEKEFSLMALAVGQMGVHLVFFLHVTTGPDNTNNVLALAFGTLIILLVMVGSLWIMAHVNHHLMSPAEMMRMQR